MSGPNWTNEQLQAISACGRNLLVSAAAGAGKTAVLVERIIRKITDPHDPVDIDSLLVVTFTKAAANEMRERVAAAISGQLNAHPDSAHLYRQLTLLNRASITTLHSFCLDVVRQYFYHLDLDPSFRIADETEAALLKLETLAELFEEYYSAGTPEFLAMVDAFGSDRDDSGLQEMVLRLHQFAFSNPRPDLWLHSLVDSYRSAEGLPPGDIPWCRTIMEWVVIQLAGCRDKLVRACRAAALPGGPADYLDTLAGDLQFIDGLQQAADNSWDDLYTAVNSAAMGRLNTCRSKDVDEVLKERVKKLRDTSKKCVAGMRDLYFSRPFSELAADLNRVVPLVETLVSLVTGFQEQYRQAKLDKAMVDFADLEHYCLQILLDENTSPDALEPSLTALDIREQFREVLVDEYQDINEVQETILRLVSKEDSPTPNRFMVGDMKQSIYRFRLADVSLFGAKYESYPRDEMSSEQAIDLTLNFRSRQEVIDGVNFVFRQLMTPVVGELAYDRRAELACGAVYPSSPEESNVTGGPVELHILDKSPQHTGQTGSDGSDEDEAAGGEDSRQDDQADFDAIQREARFTAYQIRKLVLGSADNPGPGLHVFDKPTGVMRPVSYRDIVVLLRTTRNTANTFLEEFRQAGIPAYADLDTGYFAATEVDTMLALLKIIDNPRQDVPLAAVLRSPVVGLAAQEMAAVRLRSPGGDFYDAVTLSAQQRETETDAKLAGFLDKLDHWRTKARQGRLSELIWHLYNETGYYAYAGGMPGGAQRQANLRALYDRARQFEATSFRGLFRFLRFIEKFQETGSDLGSARIAGENEDVVRVFSIHKSKGLEFPVVIVAGLGRQFNTTDLKQKYLLHKKLGLGLPVIDPDLRLQYPTIAHSAIARKLFLEMLSEEMRVLYVALTRAREKLILIGSTRELAKSAVRWCEQADCDTQTIPASALVEARSFLDWICPAVARHVDGQPLWAQVGDNISTGSSLTDPSSWQVSLWPGEIPGLDGPSAEQNVNENIEMVRLGKPVAVEGRLTAELNRRLLWQYPNLQAVGKPAKASVTELKRRFAAAAATESGAEDLYAKPTRVYARPRFLQQSRGLSPTEYGSAVHLVMQHLNLTDDLSPAGIQHHISMMAAEELLTAEQAKAVDCRVLADFFGSPLGRRMLQAPRVIRELPFTMGLPAVRVYGSLPAEPAGQPVTDNLSDEQVLVQGVIDCLLDEGDGLVVIDYKTDRVSPEHLEETVSQYKAQLGLYAEAVEAVLGRPVKEKYLYMFALGREIKC